MDLMQLSDQVLEKVRRGKGEAAKLPQELSLRLERKFEEEEAAVAQVPLLVHVMYYR